MLSHILISRRLHTRRTGPTCCYITLDPDQEATLYQTSQLAWGYVTLNSDQQATFFKEKSGQHVVIWHWILIRMRLYTRKTGPACCYITLVLKQQSTLYQTNVAASCYITLGPDQQATLYQTNRAGMMLYNTGSWTAGDVIQEELLYNIVSCSAGDFVLGEPDQPAVI